MTLYLRFIKIFNSLYVCSVINYILCALNIFFKRVLQILSNYFFKEKFFYINQIKNFFSYVLKSVFVFKLSIELN